ncbi:hypothetical protein BDQ17DRAFT_1409010 [Cyathus striatus]|nr:hypothetical protein BDQ17DRAFT_1409010 [Cyathus striatus]
MATITQLILDEVAALNATNDPATLKACALTCRGFREPSQRHLFRAVVLAPFDGQDRARKLVRFQRALSSSPHLALYVHKLTLLETSERHACFVKQLTFPQVLALLKNMTSFTLCFNFGGFDWNNAIPAFKQGFIDSILLSPSLTHLSLTSIMNLPPEFASLMTCIPSLSIGVLSFTDCDSGSLANMPISNGRLKELDLASFIDAEAERTFIEALENSNCELETLTMDNIVWEDLGLALILIEFFKTSLTTLHYPRSITHLPHEVAKLDIGKLSRLRTLNLFLEFNPSTQPGIYFRVAKQILSKATPGNQIEEIHFDIYSYNGRDLIDEGRYWEQLDILLSGPKFSDLRLVLCKFTPDHSDDAWKRVTRDEVKALATLLSIVLHRLNRRGILEVQDLLVH